MCVRVCVFILMVECFLYFGCGERRERVGGRGKENIGREDRGENTSIILFIHHFYYFLFIIFISF